MPMSKRFRILTYIFSVLLIATNLVSCKPRIPSSVIQPSKMKKILYDYHMAEAIAQTGPNTDINKTAYYDAVFKKHHVTKADFDSSMVYYARHTDELYKIYESLTDRLSKEALAAGASVTELNKYGSLTASGDTADIWAGERSTVLIPFQPYNVYSFSFVADTAFHKGDALLLEFASNFHVQDGTRDGVVVFAVRLGNDSVISTMNRLSQKNQYSLRLTDYQRKGIKEVKGFFLLNRGPQERNSATTLKLMSINNIRLIRIHEMEKPQELIELEREHGMPMQAEDVQAEAEKQIEAKQVTANPPVPRSVGNATRIQQQNTPHRATKTDSVKTRVPRQISNQQIINAPIRRAQRLQRKPQ